MKERINVISVFKKSKGYKEKIVGFIEDKKYFNENNEILGYLDGNTYKEKNGYISGILDEDNIVINWRGEDCGYLEDGTFYFPSIKR